jgi:hypothetical protein
MNKIATAVKQIIPFVVRHVNFFRSRDKAALVTPHDSYSMSRRAFRETSVSCVRDTAG